MTPISKTRFWFVVATISILLNIILFNLKSCSGKSEIEGYSLDTLTYKVQGVIYIEKEITVYKPTIVRVQEPPKELIDSVSKDSAACKELAIEHYSKKEYRDTVGNDSIKLDLTMYVSQNNVDSVKPKIILNIPYEKTIFQVIKTPIPKTPYKFYIGASIGGNQNGFLAGPELTLTDRNRMMYQVGVDFNTFGPPIYRIGVGVRLSFKK